MAKSKTNDVIEIGNTETFKLKIMDNIATIRPLPLERGLVIIAEASPSNGVTLEFDVQNEKIIAKIHAGNKGYPEKFEFTINQFAKLLHSSSRKKNSPVDDEEEIFKAADIAKERMQAKKEESNGTEERRKSPTRGNSKQSKKPKGKRTRRKTT